MKKIWFICSKNINSIRNVLFVIVFSIIFLVMMVSLTFITFIKDYYYSSLEKDIMNRTLFVGKDDNFEIEIPEVSKVEHVTYVTEWKFNSEADGRLPQFDLDDMEASARFRALLEKDEIKIVDGQNLENDGEAVCPVKFYPYSPFVKKGDHSIEKIYPSKIIKGKDIIGEEFTIKSRNSKHEDIKVKVVGTYDASANMNQMDVCYITKADREKVLSPHAAMGVTTYEDGSTETEYYPHSGLLVRVDSYKNNEEVIRKLDEMGYAAQETFYYDTQLMGYLYYVPLFILIVTFILSIGILYNYIRKRVLYRLKEYAIYLSVGYSKEYIKKINIFESIVLILVSLFISLIIYFISYYILIYGLLSEIMFYSTRLNIPYLNILSFLAGIILCLIIVTNYLLKKKVNDSICRILSENEGY